MKKMLSMMIALVVAVCIPCAAFAVDSPDVEPTVALTATVSDSNAGSVTKTVIDAENNIYEITATPSDGYEFTSWVFTNTSTGDTAVEGTDYVFVSGTSTDATIQIQLLTEDVTATAQFTAVSTSSDTSSTTSTTGTTSTTSGSSSTTSPKTGDHTAVILLASVASLVGAAYVCKKLFA